MACWQLRAAGMTWDAIEHRTAGLRRLHDGVCLTGEAAPTQRQRWWAAALSAPGRVLSHASAATAHGFGRNAGSYEVVTAGGSGGARRFGDLLVCRSTRMDVTTLDGIPITTPERTVADLWPYLPAKQQRKLLREALRVKATTVPRLLDHLAEAPARNRPASLTRLCKRYEHLQLHRCRSDAEAYAVELIADAHLPLPEINVRRAGEEADLSWPAANLIVEIDGDQFHQDKSEDARKTKAWRQAGWQVTRATSDDVFDQPMLFTQTVRAALRRCARAAA